MARRRLPRRSGGPDRLMALYGDITARERAQQQAQFQHELNAQLARLQKELELENAKVRQRIDTGQAMLPRVVSGDMEPGQFVGAGLADDLFGGPEGVAALAPTPQQRLSPYLKQTREATTREAVPGEEDIFGALGTTREAAQPSMLEAATGAMQARNARLTDMGAAEDRGIDIAGLTSQSTALGGGRGREMATAEAFPAELQRELQKTQQVGDIETRQRLGLERGMTDILVERAQRETQVREEAQALAKQSAGNVAGLISVANAAPKAQEILDTIYGPDVLDQQDPDALLNKADDTLMPGVGSAFGRIQGMAPGMFNPSANARRNRLVNQQTLDALVQLRSQIATGASPLGQSSDTDVRIMQQAVTTLADPRINEAVAQRELQRLATAARTLKAKSQEAAAMLGAQGQMPSRMTLPGEAGASAPSPASERLNRLRQQGR